MKNLKLTILFLIIIPLVFAQLPDSNILPPSLPSEDEIPLTLELFNFDSKEPVKNIHARLSFVSENDKINTLKYVPENSRLKINLLPNTWNLKILIDDISTPGKDFTYETTIYLKNPTTEKIYLFPSGSVQGIVLLNGNAVPLAKVFLYCSGSEEVKETVTDATGFFYFDWIPVGDCRSVSVFNNNRGEASFSVSKGIVSEAKIELTDGVFQSFNFLIYIITAVFFFCFFGFLVFILFKNRKSKPVKSDKKAFEKKKVEVKKDFSLDHAEKKPVVSASRIDDILKTLNYKEKAIVNFLLENKNHSSQAVIKNNLNIPKTTIIRLFQALESKNIISIERVGKLKKISLTEWFAEKK
jgi:uncharacterized membrane protein